MKFYLDTSVFGGYWDEIFKKDTIEFLEFAEDSNAEIIYSNVTEQELERAPQRVKELIRTLSENRVIIMKAIEMDDEAEILANKYIEEGALPKKCEADAKHIALASIHNVNVLVSWNIRHMVNFFRVQQYNSINLRLGYKPIDIRTPKETIQYNNDTIQ